MPWGAQSSSRATACALAVALALVAPAAGDRAADPLTALEQGLAGAEALLQRGQLQAAEEVYRRALVEGWMLLGTLERVDGRWPAARDAFGKAMRAAPEHALAVRSYAGALLQTGEAARAAEVLGPLAAKDPRDGETRRMLAKAQAAQGRLEEALRTLEEAAAAAPGDPELAYLLATEYLWLKKPEPAERLFARVLEARPIPQTRVLVGRTYRDAGEYERARTMLRQALAEDPAVRRAHYYLGMVLLADPGTGPERLEAAIAEFRAELKLEPRDALASDQLGAALLEAGRPEEALPALETAVREQPRARPLRHLGHCQLALGRAAEAAATLERALAAAEAEDVGPAERGAVRYQLGLALRKLGREEEAAAHLAEAGRLTAAGVQGTPGAPGGSVPQMETSPLAEIPAERRTEIAARTRQGLARAYLNLGVMRAHGERFAEAAELLEQAAALAPDLPRVQYALGVARFNAKQYAASLEPLRRARETAPGDAGLARMLGLAWLNTGEYARAADLLEDDPGLATDPSVQLACGLALLRSGREWAALPHLEKAARAAPDDADIRFALGQAYEKLGRTEQAAREFEASRRLRAGKGGER